MADDPLTSPAAQFGRQAKTEATIGAIVRGTATDALRQVGTLAIREGLNGLTPAQVSGIWAGQAQDHLARAVKAGRLTRDEAMLVLASMLASEIPEQAYTSARAVLLAAQAEQWSARETEAQVRLAMSLDTPEVLLAAARASMKDALAAHGTGWRDSLDALITTTATGMQGRTTLSDLIAARFPEKRWVTRHDSKVRDTHRSVDGDTIPLSEPFMVGGSDLMYPGDPAGTASEVINCRCILVGVRAALAPVFISPDDWA